MLVSEEKGLLSDQIRLALTDEITTGHLKPGSALDEQQIADRFGASRTPVREALRQLAVTGLVELRPRRGVIVAPMTAERVLDMFETMAEVEAMCVRLATFRITPMERSRLFNMHEASGALVRDGDVNLYDTFNLEFHGAIYYATHNEFMAEQALAIRSRLMAFRRMQLRLSDRLTRSHAEHGEVIGAMASGDGEEAARRMRAHMLNASGPLATYIKELEAGEGMS
jgi:DNA-binding GntR family transcriptional regulator